MEGLLSSSQSLARLPVGDTSTVALAAAPDADFDVRWAAWVARGHAHERLVRRKLFVLGGALATATAIVYAFMR